MGKFEALALPLFSGALHEVSNRHGSKWIRRAKRVAIYERDGWACVYCGSPDELTLDHIDPRSCGGSNHAINLLTACYRCNSKRKDQPFEAFVKNKRKAKKLRLQAGLPLGDLSELALEHLFKEANTWRPRLARNKSGRGRALVGNENKSARR